MDVYIYSVDRTGVKVILKTMCKKNLLYRIIWFYLLGAICLIACGSKASITPIKSTTQPVLLHPTDTNIEIAQSTTPSRIPSSSPTITPSSHPQYLLQLTYIAEKTPLVYGVYAITFGCPDEAPPCLSEPELLFDDPYPILLGGNTFSWSPDGQRMVYDSVGEDGRSDIFVIDWDGQNRERLTESGINESFPAWSPDGSRIIYSSSTIETRQILSFKPDGSDQVLHLTPSIVNNPSFPNWSPDGKRLTFTGYNDAMNPAHIFVANLDGSSLVQVTNAALNSHSPVFSPDGLWIAFTKDVKVPNSLLGDIVQNIFLIRPDGSGELLLTEDLEKSQLYPDWSPMGNWIAYNSYKPLEETDIYIVKPDGTQITNVTNTPDILKWWPAWRIVFLD